MKHANKILYIGSGLHIEPVTHFKDTKKFVFVDTQPRNEFDSYLPKFSTFAYKTKFFAILLEKCKHYNFNLESVYCMDTKYYKKIMSWKQLFHYLFNKLPEFINPTLLVFVNHNTNQTIHYYVSTNIKFNMKPVLRIEIESCDGIIVSGYHPDIKLLRYIKQPMSFFGYTETCYTIYNVNLGEHQSDNIIYFLQTHIAQNYFNHFYMVVKESGTIVKCKDFSDFKLAIENNK